MNLSILSNPKNLATVRKKIRGKAVSSGFTKDEAGKIAFAVDEVCTNSIRHSYLNNHNKKIDIKIHPTARQMKITVRDYGIKPDLNKIKGCLPKRIKPGGLGVYCLKKIMDKVIYNTNLKKGTKVTLVKLHHYGNTGRNGK